MALKYIAVAVVAVAITLFALQNSAPTSIRFVVWQLDAVPRHRAIVPDRIRAQANSPTRPAIRTYGAVRSCDSAAATT